MIGLIVLIFTLIILLLFVFMLNFYRDPERDIPKGNNVVSPADGKIISIIKIKSSKTKVKKGYFGKIETMVKNIANECYVISIFMSPLDVHINRIPIDGKIVSIKHDKGKFFAAYNTKKSLMNEKNEIVLKNDKMGRIKLIQIAGFLARRIICSVNKNQKVNKGQKFGKIVLGSQLTFILPAKKIKLVVRKGQKVKAGCTIIANIR